MSHTPDVAILSFVLSILSYGMIARDIRPLFAPGFGLFWSPERKQALLAFAIWLCLPVTFFFPLLSSFGVITVGRANGCMALGMLICATLVIIHAIESDRAGRK